MTYNSYISGSDEKVLDNTNPEACATSCLSEASFICRSFEFDNSTNRCSMSSKSTINSGLASASSHRFFELSKYTHNGPINFQYVLKVAHYIGVPLLAAVI